MEARDRTIVLIHGLWMTPRSWEQWVAYYSARGYNVLAPAYPGLEVDVEALRADPAVVEHYAEIVRGLDRSPILMGHSFGGVLVQILLDHGLGAAGVAIDSVPAEGILVTPVSQIRASFPVLRNPANRHRAVPLTPEPFHYAFTNTLSAEESLAVYERYLIPALGGFVWGGVLANFTPGHQDTYVDFENDDRAPSSSSPAARTTSCPRRSTRPTPSTTAALRRSRSTRSSPGAPTTPCARKGGRRSPTTPSAGPPPARPVLREGPPRHPRQQSNMRQQGRRTR